jgi:hypothetical protein
MKTKSSEKWVNGAIVFFVVYTLKLHIMDSYLMPLVARGWEVLDSKNVR